MLKLVSYITIGAELEKPIYFDFVNEIDMESAYDNLTDTCKITIPRNLSLKGKPIAVGSEAIFKRGMSIKIELGYDDNLKTVFQGYISHVHLSIPVTLECEDSMWLLKNNTLDNKSWASVDLKTFLKYIIPSSVSYTTDGFTYENLGKFRISNNATSAQCLDTIRKNNNIISFFRNNKLYVGVAFHESLTKTKVFGSEKNVIDDKSLEWMDRDEVKIKVQGASVQSNNKVIKYTYPENLLNEKVPTTKLNVAGISLSQLKKNCKDYYNKFQYTGYKGSFLTFGEPLINHGDKVGFNSDKLPERNDDLYIVKSVKRSFGQGGYRQTIELGQKITSGEQII